MKYILTVLTLLTIMFVSVGQEKASYYELDAVSSYDQELGDFTDFIPCQGYLAAQGNTLALAVPEYGIRGEFQVVPVDKQETEEESLVKFVDVEKQVVVWLYKDKLRGHTIIRLTGSGAGIQFSIKGEIKDGESDSSDSSGS